MSDGCCYGLFCLLGSSERIGDFSLGRSAKSTDRISCRSGSRRQLGGARLVVDRREDANPRLHRVALGRWAAFEDREALRGALVRRGGDCVGVSRRDVRGGQHAPNESA